MNKGTPAALDGLLAQLLRRGLPAEYARRAVAELADHHQDLVDELRAAGESDSQAAAEAARRLGEPRTLVKKTVREYQRRYWCGRRPLLTFLLGPIALVIFTWVATWLLCWIIAWPFERMGMIGPHEPNGILEPWEWLVLRGSQVWMLLAMPALVMITFGRLAGRAAMGQRWVAMSAVMLALFCGLFLCQFAGNSFQVRWPRDQFLLMAGLPFIDAWRATGKWYAPDPWYLAQLMLPLGIAGMMMYRSRQMARRAAQLVSFQNSQGDTYEYAKSA